MTFSRENTLPAGRLPTVMTPLSPDSWPFFFSDPFKATDVLFSTPPCRLAWTVQRGPAGRKQGPIAWALIHGKPVRWARPQNGESEKMTSQVHLPSVPLHRHAPREIKSALFCLHPCSPGFLRQKHFHPA